MSRACAALLAVACASEPLAKSERCADTSKEEQAYVAKCLPQSLDPVEDPSSPDYGRVNCMVIEARLANPQACACAGAGYRPATEAQKSFAVDDMRSHGQCVEHCCDGPCCAVSCCENLCFCELVQFSGEELAACQDRTPEPTSEPVGGFCYLEPDAGFGDPTRVDFCPPGEGWLFRMLPSYGANHMWLTACVTDAG